MIWPYVIGGLVTVTFLLHLGHFARMRRQLVQANRDRKAAAARCRRFNEIPHQLDPS